jgi:hypothetical protein
MVRGVVRSLTIALLTAIVALIAEGVYVGWFCSRHQAWLRAHSRRAGIVLKHQYGIPRATDAVFACERIHHVGPFPLHPDLIYYCAPPTTDLSRVPSLAGTACVVEPKRANVSQYCDGHADL